LFSFAGLYIEIFQNKRHDSGFNSRSLNYIDNRLMESSDERDFTSSVRG